MAIRSSLAQFEEDEMLVAVLGALGAHRLPISRFGYEPKFKARFNFRHARRPSEWEALEELEAL